MVTMGSGARTAATRVGGASRPVTALPLMRQPPHILAPQTHTGPCMCWPSTSGSGFSAWTPSLT